VRLDLAYDGTEFSGWAAQPGRRTVEGELGAALARVLRLTEPPALVVAGRTDAGVHARGQVVHVDLAPDVLGTAAGSTGGAVTEALSRRLAGVLPDDVVVRRVSLAPNGFDARFAATQRRYSYRVCDDGGALDPVRRRETLLVRGRLDVPAMNAASAQLAGLHDFAAFCRRREGATTVRTLLEYTWHRDSTDAGEGLVVARVVADAFCHSMVRALVGAVLEVGRGRRDVAWPRQLLVAVVRDPTAPVVPAHGLCRHEVTYPPDDQLAQRVTQARARRDEREKATGTTIVDTTRSTDG
jgi:tRNA pseudouridine38-40 synthase